MRRIITFALTLLTTTALAQSPQDYAGTWTVPFGSHIFAIVQLNATQDGHLTGTITLPHHFTLSNDGSTLSGVQLPTDSHPIDSVVMNRNALHIFEHKASDPTDKDEFILTVTGKDSGNLAIVGAPFEPFVVVRVHTPSSVSADFNPDRSYSLLDSNQSSPEMRKIFDEDQRVRAGVVWTPAWGKSLAPADAARRAQVRTMLAHNQLHSADDFTWAAHIFQHGDTPQDYLLAHTLALAALARGKQDASWIAAATLDRYLQSIGQPQIYGTQFTQNGSNVTVSQPYDSSLISAELRKQLAVPPPERGAQILHQASQPKPQTP